MDGQARCDCRIDWVACFRSDCPRAAAIKAEQQRRVQTFLGLKNNAP